MRYAFLNHLSLWFLKIVRALWLRFSGINLTTSSTSILKMDPRASGKETSTLANVDCIMLQARFYSKVGGKATSKRRMFGGSLGRWGGISIRFSVLGQTTYCGCYRCSIISPGGYICCSRGDWPFPLIASVQEKKFLYTPRSDFHISVDQLVYLLVEVQSEKDQSDRYRMLLQGACVARLGCQLNDKPHIVVALYIENCGRVTRYLLFQQGRANAVCTFESKQFCIFSLALLGFLCLGGPRLDATVRVVYHYIRNVQPGIDNST